jgi:hypothetical protein
MSFSNTADFGKGSPGNYVVFIDPSTDAGSSGKYRSFFVQWDFYDHFGVAYSQGKSSSLPLTVAVGSGLGGPVIDDPGTGSISGNVFSLEARYPVTGWLDIFGRVNEGSFTVSAVGEPLMYEITPVSTAFNRSDEQTFLSAGLRMRIAQHVGVELIYSDYVEILNPAVSLGLYVEF